MFVPHVPAFHWAFVPFCSTIFFEPLCAAVLNLRGHVVAAAPLTSRGRRASGVWLVQGTVSASSWLKILPAGKQELGGAGVGRDGEQGAVGMCEEGQGVCLGECSHFCSSSQDLC